MCNGSYVCDHIDQYSVRMGLPCEAMFTVRAHIAASSTQSQAPPLLVSSIHKNQTIVEALQGKVFIHIPVRDTLPLSSLRYPPLDKNTHVKGGRGKQELRGRKHGR